jgi:hypothetical protein
MPEEAQGMLDELRTVVGIESRNDIVRYAIAKLAQDYKINFPLNGESEAAFLLRLINLPSWVETPPYRKRA